MGLVVGDHVHRLVFHHQMNHGGDGPYWVVGKGGPDGDSLHHYHVGIWWDYLQGIISP